ncbi:winged helix-turn-helix domain-containing protein [Paraburkholderia caribensis]|uniref:winged helix-turn-helix domain-containing protein n=1 Tax=Paraburkholderia caribensis TaxID=75105 RepID=UPI0034D2A637
MRFLLVENDVQTGQKLFRALREARYTVDWIRNGKDADAAIACTNYAVVLLELGLTDIAGIDLLKAVRTAGNPVPVLTLAGPDDVDARIASLDAGADDCLIQAINARELLARLRAVLRRKAGYATSRIGNESLSLDLDMRTLHQDGVASPLSAREFALMHSFMERPGSILSRGQLEDRIYGWGREVESNAVDVLIHSMRKRFGQSLIRNVRGLGWMVAPSTDARAASTGLRH